MKSRYQRKISGVDSTGHSVGPPTMLLTGCRRNLNDVTTPQFPPPPRSAQKRSGCSSALAVTSSPLASTSSADSRLSIVSPYLRVR